MALEPNDPQGALTAADEAPARDVDDVEALLVRARSLLQLGQRQSALTAAERLVTLRREWVPGLLTRGFLYHLVGDHSAAAQDARAILELHDDQPTALFLLGSATLDLPDGDPAEARPLLRRAAERLHPRDPERATVARRIQEARQRANR